MAGERVGSLPADVREWVEARADEQGVDRAEILQRALTAYRYLADESGEVATALEDGEDALGGVDVDELRTRLDEHEERLERLDERLDATESDVDEKIQDVRERVIQVKRETDQKAPADHDHPEIRGQARQAAAESREATERVEDLETTVDEGFENFEDILSYLTETTDEHDRKVDVLANAVVDVRHRLVDIESSQRARAAVADLREEANRHGATTAKCDDCSSTVHLSLLDRPNCPECGATFDGFEPSRGFFGSATLTVGSRPALVGEEEPVESADELFEDEGRADE